MGSETELATLRDESPRGWNQARRLLTMLAKIQVVRAPKIHEPHEVPPEMEERLRQLEREIAQGLPTCGRAERDYMYFLQTIF